MGLVIALCLLFGVSIISGFKVFDPNSDNPKQDNIIRIGLCLPFTAWPEFVTGGGVDTLELHLQYLSDTTALLPDAKVELKLFDPGNTKRDTYRTLLKLRKENFTAFIGCGMFTQTQPAALLWSALEIPQCDGRATSPLFSSKNNYPFFIRTIPSEALTGASIANIVSYYGWKRVAVVYSDDASGQSLLESFTAQAKAKSIDIVSRNAIFPDAAPNWADTLRAIRATKASIIVYLAMPESLSDLLEEASKKEMIGPKYAWIVNNVTEMLSNPAASPRNLELFDGLLTLSPMSTTEPPIYHSFLSYWKNNIKRTNSLVKSVNTLPPYSTFYMDCTQLLLSGFQNYLDIDPKNTLRQIVVRNVSWTMPNNFLPSKDMENLTVSGPLIMDESGDRTAFYEILNFHNGKLQKIGTAINDSIRLTEQATFAGNSRDIPSDTFRKPAVMDVVTMAHGGMIFLSIVACMGVATCLGILFILYKFHTSFRSSSPLFSGTLAIGIALDFLASFVSILSEPDVQCLLDNWMIFLSFGLVYGSLLVKNYRIHKIFNSRGGVKGLSDKELGLQLVAIMTAEILPLIVLSAASPPSSYLFEIDEGVFQYKCLYPSQTTFDGVYGFLLAFNACVLLFGTYIAIRTRNVPSNYSESIYIGLCTYNILIVACFCLPILTYLNISAVNKVIFRAVALIYCGIFTLGVIFIPILKKANLGNSVAESMSSMQERATKTNKSATSHLAIWGHEGRLFVL
jgi:gamma-aminobutyric acid type B receptor